MDMRIIKVNKGKTIPFPIRFVCALFIVLGIIEVLRNLAEPWSILIAILLSFILPGVWFATNIIIIDLEKKALFDGVWTLGVKMGKSVSIEGVDKLYLNKVKTKQTLYSLSNQQNVIANHEFQAYLKVQSGETYFLFSHPIEERAEEKLTKIRKKLKLKQ